MPLNYSICDVCDSIPGENPGKAVADLAALASRLDKLETDFAQRVSTFRCKECGQTWEERYEARGHSNIPTVYRLPM